MSQLQLEQKGTFWNMLVRRELPVESSHGGGRRNEAGKPSWSEKKSEQIMLAECRTMVLVEIFQEVNFLDICVVVKYY